VENHEKFELRRLSDELVYSFERKQDSSGRVGYQRTDQDFWIVQKPSLGWVAWDEASQSVMGRPWNVLPEDQADHPPEGDWVSRKGVKSYVYRLIYV
jgi:hypothetical protein